MTPVPAAQARRRARRPAPQRRGRMILATAVLIALALSGGALMPGGALRAQQAPAGPAAQMSEAAQTLRRATEELAQASEARDRVQALTATIRAYEAGQAALREAVRRAALREGQIAARLQADEMNISRLLGVMSGMESASGALLLLHPQGPTATARAGMVLAEVTPALQAQAARLRAELEEVRALREGRAQAIAALQTGVEDVQGARAALWSAISERETAPHDKAADDALIARIVAGATTLDAAAAELAAVPLAPAGAAPGTGAEAPPALAALKGSLPLPAFGTVLRAANEPDAAGIVRPGLILATEPRAMVTAPVAATIRYAGPLLDYANVMILEPESGYLVILGGMSQVFRPAGELVAAGDALGLMGGNGPTPAEFAATGQNGSGTPRTETLYIEIRQGTEPVDPAGWFAVTRE